MFPGLVADVCIPAARTGITKKLISHIPAKSVTCDTGNIYVLSKEDGEEVVLQKTIERFKFIGQLLTFKCENIV